MTKALASEKGTSKKKKVANKKIKNIKKASKNDKRLDVLVKVTKKKAPAKTTQNPISRDAKKGPINAKMAKASPGRVKRNAPHKKKSEVKPSDEDSSMEVPIIELARKKSANKKKAETKEKENKEEKTKTKNNKEAAATTTLSPSSSDYNVDEDDDRAACCLCHCGIDYSDRCAFFEADRLQDIEEEKNNNDSDSEESLYYQLTDPYVPAELYDPSNALVYCDGCNRLYHQKCHFVPLMTVPRGNWYCLVCTTSKQLTRSKNASVKDNGNKESPKETKFSKAQIKRMFQSPPPPEKLQLYLFNGNNDNDGNNDKPNSCKYHTSIEMEWETASRRAKAALWQKTLTQTVPSSIQSQLSNWRQAKAALETLTRTKQNRQHFLENKASSRGSQELAQTLVKLTNAKFRMRQIIMNMEQIRVNPERHLMLLEEWSKRMKEGTEINVAIAASYSNDAIGVYPKDPSALAIKKASSEEVTNQSANHLDKKSIENSKPAEFDEINPADSKVAKDSATAPDLSANAPKSRPPPKSFLERVVFPFGQYPPRTIPRTPEMEEAEEEEATNGIPKDIVTSNATETSDTPLKKKTSNSCESRAKGKTQQAKSKKHVHQSPAKAKDDKNEGDDGSSSGVSLDDLKCCICLIGDATDDNDLLLCDGQGCFRAYHMGCLEPRLTREEVEGTEDEDWFCPLCTNLAECMHSVQSYYNGEEWDHRRADRAYYAAKKAREEASPQESKSNKCDDDNADEPIPNDEDDDDDSLKSWTKAEEVFPNAEKEYESALQLKAGKRNEDTDELLRLILGAGDDQEEAGGGNLLDYISDGTDDEELDQHFDLEEFHKERQREYEEMDEESDGGDDSTHSSQATLVDMSSVELKIGKDELGALSEGSDSESEPDSGDENNGPARRSRRLRNKENKPELPKDMGVEFDPNNIVHGKRRRKAVDYRKLNDSLFGGLDDAEIANIDDKEDFEVKLPKKMSSDDEGIDSNESDDGDDGNEGENNGESDPEQGSDTDEKAASNKKKKQRKDRGRKAEKGKAKKKVKASAKSASRKRQQTFSDEDVDSGNEAECDDSLVDSTTKKKKGRRKESPAKKKTKHENGVTNGVKTAKSTGKTKPKKSPNASAKAK